MQTPVDMIVPSNDGRPEGENDGDYKANIYMSVSRANMKL